MDWLGIAMRWAHILAAVTAVGGAFFMRFALLPAGESMSADERKRFAEAVRARWVIPLHIAITLLLVSGLYNIAMIEMRTSPVGKLYHPLFGIKFLLALVIFFIAIRLAGRSAGAERFRLHARRWLNINVTLAVILICISGVLGKTEKPLKNPEKTPPADAIPVEG